MLTLALFSLISLPPNAAEIDGWSRTDFGDYDYTAYKRDMRRTTVREGTEPHLMETGDDPYTALFAKSPKSVDINSARDAGR